MKSFKGIMSAVFLAVLFVGVVSWSHNQVRSLWLHYMKSDSVSLYELPSEGLTCVSSSDPLAPKLFCLPSMDVPANWEDIP